MATIGTLLIELSANVARLETDLGKASGHVQRTERMMKQSVDRMNGFFGLLGVSLSGAAIVAYSKRMIDAADATGDLAERAGLTVEEIAGLQHAAMQSATDVNKLADASNKLGTALTNKPELFKKLGIDATTGMGAMVQLADVFETMPEGINKNALAAKLFGDRLGAEMIPFLNQGTASIKGLIAEGQRLNPLTTEQARRAAELNDQLDKMGFQMQGAGMQMMSYLIPGLTETATRMQALATEGHPVLALWRGLAGMGQIPWGFLFPPEDLGKSLSSANRLKDMQSELAAIEDQLKPSAWHGKGGGVIGHWLHGSTDEQQQRATILRNQIETLKKHSEELDKKPASTPATTKTGGGAPDLSSSTDGMQVLKALELDYQNTLAKRAEAMNYPLMSASERALADDLRSVHDSASKSRVELEKLNVAGKLSASDYTQRLKELKAEEDAQVEAITRMRIAQDELNGSWQYGAKVAMRNYIDEASNTAKQSEALFGRAFHGMSDELAKFVQTGKMDFASLRDSIIADLLRIQMQKAVAGVLGSIFVGGTGSGYGDTAGVAAGVPSYEGGGSTGTGPRAGGIDGRGGFPAILHPDETVVDHTLGKSSASSGGGGGLTIVINDNSVVNVDARSDRAQTVSELDQLVDAKQARMIETLRRERSLV